MLEGYDVSKLLDETGKFRTLDDKPVEDLSNQSQFVKNLNQTRTQINTMINRYYQNSLPKQKDSKRISNRIKGNQKQLLQDTISDLSQQYPEVGKLRGFLMDTAALESGYKLTSTSNASTASGWFGFLDSTKKNILKQLGIKATREQFNKNPQIQVLAATKLYQEVVKQAKREGVLNVAALKGFSEEEVVHAYWLNPTWAKEYFLYGKKGGTDAYGTSVEKYIKKIRGIK